MVCFDGAIMRQGVSQNEFQLNGTTLYSGKQLVDHVHSGHVVTENANENVLQVGLQQCFAHRTQFQVVVVQNGYICRPSVLYKLETLQTTVPSPPATCACISANDNGALGGEPISGCSLLLQLQPELGQIAQCLVGKLHITFPTISLRKNRVQTHQVEAPKGYSIGTGLQETNYLGQLAFVAPTPVLLQVAKEVFTQL